MIRLFQVKCASEDQKEIEARILKKLHIEKRDLFAWSIHRKSVDARHREIFFSYTVDCSVRNEQRFLKRKDIQPTPDETYHPAQPGSHPLKTRPYVIGFGPAGMFAAYTLAQAGYCPVIIERGSRIEQRRQKTESFWHGGPLDPECNVQFGEGGAGAFSDGKLTTRSKDPRCRKVLSDLVHLGADPEILIDQHPHIGTDAFEQIIIALRKEIEQLGGTFCFDARLDDLQIENGKLTGICVNGSWSDCSALILAIGHSARDTVMMLHHRGLAMENKRFAVGVRIEHTQEWVNRAMLRDHSTDPRLIPARYQLTYTTSANKGVYTFCMCPGGYVISACAQPGHLVVNGMSYADRGGTNANSALLVQVDASDYGNELFAGLHYQEAIEQKAYEVAGGYQACCQRADDYLYGGKHAFTVQPTYQPAVSAVDLNTVLPMPVNDALHEALPHFEAKVPGFVSSGAVLTAPETRSSSAVRIVRHTDLTAGFTGVYPCGEGSGYAGGIMTSAVDGIRCAEKLIEYFAYGQ